MPTVPRVRARRRTSVVLAAAVAGVAFAACAPDGAAERPGSLDRAEVVHVTDGDTIVVRLDGEEVRVRYIGIDAPEAGEECLASEATEANAALVEGRTVELERDVSETDRFGRLLRYVWLETDTGRVLVNRELVEGGFAEAVEYPPDVERMDELYDAQDDARETRAGIWGEACAA